jgi:exodeoxyribonuclease VII small subunit
MKFEEKLKRLEEIVQQMENPKKELKELIALFKEGSVLTKECREELSDMDNEVKKVIEEVNMLDEASDDDSELPF